MADIDTLRILSGKATPGPYSITTCMDFWVEASDIGIAHCGDIRWVGSEEVISDEAQMEANARYIAACDPQTILALLDELERLRSRVKEIQS